MERRITERFPFKTASLQFENLVDTKYNRSKQNALLTKIIFGNNSQSKCQLRFKIHIYNHNIIQIAIETFENVKKKNTIVAKQELSIK